jgi:hypothetical protein
MFMVILKVMSQLKNKIEIQKFGPFFLAGRRSGGEAYVI